LWVIVRIARADHAGQGSWISAFALFVYAATFSFAYSTLSAATGALLLFGAVQATMIGYGLLSGERLRTVQLAGLLVALGGFVGLLLPGLSAPPLLGSVLMLSAGAAWAVYSLRGRGAGDPIRVTSDNFLRAVPMAVVMSLLLYEEVVLDARGASYAVLSGAFASGMGYAIWYTALPSLRATSAATVQLSVPVITAVGGIALIGEPITLRLVLASVAILSGIALVMRRQ
jgi:drug/metabolite transporter (DMT)-like permease